MTEAQSLPSAIEGALVVEDVAETRDWLVRLLKQTFGAIEVWAAGDLRSARHWLHGRDTSAMKLIALVDLGLPDGSGVDLIRELREGHPTVQVIVSTIYDDDNHLLHAIAAGAHGYLLKDRETDELIDQLRRVGRGEAALSPTVARRLLEQFRAHANFITGHTTTLSETPSLTEREVEVLRYIGRGLTLNEAAQVMEISSQTVATHVKSIYRKLGIATRAEAALEAARRRLT